MLEWGARDVGEAENGSFLQVSGLTYKIDTSIPDTTKANEMDIWTGGPDEYRVWDVKIYNKKTDTWDELDLDAKYNLAGYNYTLRNLGDGFAMLDGAVNVVDYVMEDYMVLAYYTGAFENGVIDAKNSPLLARYGGFKLDYGNVGGSGRIEAAKKTTVKNPASEQTAAISNNVNAPTERNSEVNASPKTADNSIIVAWIMAMIVGMSVYGLVTLRIKVKVSSNHINKKSD